MKKFTLLVVLLLSTVVAVGQSKEKFNLDEKDLTFSVYYGTAKTLGAEVTVRRSTNIIGFGYAFYLPKPDTDLVGTDVPTFDSDVPNSGNGYYAYSNHPMFNYSTPNSGYYLVLGRQIKRLGITARVGAYNEANYRIFQKDVDPGEDEENPYYEFYHSKEVTGLHILLGASVSYTLSTNVGFSVGYDNFSKATAGLFVNF